MRFDELDLGTRLLPYEPTWQLQREVHAAVADGTREDTVLLCEHEDVYTAGRRTATWDRPVDGTPVVDVDRGGRITWHGPGQLVGYPIVRLATPIDVVRYVRVARGGPHPDVRRPGPRPRSASTGAAGSGSPPTTTAGSARSPRSACASPAASPCTASR